jgi:hypothetical protein
MCVKAVTSSSLKLEKERQAREERWSAVLDFVMTSVLAILLVLVIGCAMFYALRRWL